MKKIVVIAVLLFNMLFAQGVDEALNRSVTLSYKDTPLSVVFKIMSKTYKFDYVITQVGTERVSVNITNIPLKDALNAILLPLGYHYFVQNDLVIIKKIEDTASGELQTFVYKCKYKSADYLRSIIVSALSPSGQVGELESKKTTANKQFSRKQILVIKDVGFKIAEVKQILEQLDVKEKQILIEVKLVERMFSDGKNAGINWPTKFGVKNLSYPPQQQQGGSTEGQEQFTGWYTGMPDLDEGWTWGVIAVQDLNMYMELLRTENNSKIVSNPKVATENNSPAIVNISTTVPVPEISRSAQGDLISYKDKEVSSFIEVLPVINDDGSISLTVHPKLEEIIGYAGASDNPQPIVAKREVTTRVTVKDGEALIIGGLIKENESKIVNKVFLLGDIPVLGYLFRHYSIKKEKSDLLIIITPRIIEN